MTECPPFETGDNMLTAKGFRISVLLIVTVVLLALVNNIQIVRSSATIHIGADGSIDGTDKIERVEDTYTLLADISGSIVVERDGIVLDGCGHMLRGPGAQIPESIGVYLNGTLDVTIKNIQIESFFIGIWLYYCSNSQIVENVLIDNKNGVSLYKSSNNVIKGNKILNIWRIFTAIWLDHSSRNDIMENRIAGNSNGITIHESSNNMISANNMTDNSRALSEYYCTNSTIRQNYIANNDRGLVLTGCSSSLIFGNYIKNNNYGLQLYNSSGNLIFHNSLTHNMIQAYTEYSFNTWHKEYPVGGNYWSDHNPPDEDLDRIGDLAYIIDANDFDQYPLIYPYGFVPKPDVNEDGIVNIIDIATVATAFGSKPGDERWDPMTDMDMNGIVNIIDIADVARNFG